MAAPKGHGFFNFQLETCGSAESRILKQSSEQRERQFSEPLKCLKMWECFVMMEKGPMYGNLKYKQ